MLTLHNVKSYNVDLINVVRYHVALHNLDFFNVVQSNSVRYKLTANMVLYTVLLYNVEINIA